MGLAAKATARGCIAVLLAVGLDGCREIKQADPQAATKARVAAKRQQAACGSALAFDRLKGLLFDAALRGDAGNKAELDALADYSFVRMDKPIVKGWDPALEITRCEGRIFLEMPAGVRGAFGGERRLQADVDYTAQVAADGSGLVYALTGAEPIVDRLAGFRLAGRAYQPPPAIDPGADAPPPVELAEAEIPLPLPSAKRMPAPVPPIVARVDRPAAPRPDRPLQRAEPVPAPELASDRPEDGEAVVRGFYAALGAGDGAAASARIIPEKQDSRAFAPEAITRFYGRLAEPLRLTGITQVSRNAYRVRYRYSAGRSACDGTAVVKLVDRGGQTMIRGIDAVSGC